MSQFSIASQHQTPTGEQSTDIKFKINQKLRSISTNKQYHNDPLKQKRQKSAYKKRENSFVLDCQRYSINEDLNYDPLLDNNLRLFFYKPKNKMNLIKHGLLKRDGSPANQKIYRDYLNSSKTFYEKEVVKKYKKNKLPPIIKIEQLQSPQKQDHNESKSISQQSSTKQKRKSSQGKQQNNSISFDEDSLLPNDHKTPQKNAKEKIILSSDIKKYKIKNPYRYSSTIEKERAAKKNEMISTYGCTLEELKEQKQNIKKRIRNQISPKAKKEGSDGNIVDKDEFNKFMQSFREKYQKKQVIVLNE